MWISSLFRGLLPWVLDGGGRRVRGLAAERAQQDGRKGPTWFSERPAQLDGAVALRLRRPQDKLQTAEGQGDRAAQPAQLAGAAAPSRPQDQLRRAALTVSAMTMIQSKWT